MSSYLDKATLTYFWTKLKSYFQPQETGKGLSSNDYTDTDKSNLSSYGNLMGVWARNVGDMEGKLDDIESQNADVLAEAKAVNDNFAAVQNAIITAGLEGHVLNTPNLINPNRFWNGVTSDPKVYGNVSRSYAMGYAHVKSFQAPVMTEYDEEPEDKGDSYWYNSETGKWQVYKDADDFRVSVAALSSALVDEDGESYSYALQWVITANSAYGNSENLIFYYGSDGGTYEKEVTDAETGETTTQTVTYGPSGLVDMVEGETYTISCWVRITSGSKARITLSYGWDGWDGWGNGYPNSYAPTHAAIDITNTEWKRVYWTFVYKETISGSSLSFKKRVGFGVYRVADATVQLCGFRLTKGNLYENNTLDSIAAEIAALRQEVADLQAIVLENA